MKPFDKPWIEIVNINMNEVIVTSGPGHYDEVSNEIGGDLEGE